MSMKSRLSEKKTSVVENILERFISSWNNKNLEQFGELFSENAEFTDVVGQTAIGRDAIIKQHVYPFENVMKFARFSIKNAYVRLLSDNLIIVSALWKVTGSVTPNGENLPDRNGVLQIIIEMDSNNDNAFIKMVHNSDNALPYEKQEKFIE